ncbi:hypothetical protein [Polaromonas sp. P5_D5]
MFVATFTSWWHKDDPDLGIMNTISHSLSRYELAHPDGMPNLRNDASLTVALDFGGAHRESPYETMGVLLVGNESILKWAAQQESVRMNHLPDWRRMSYKGLNDRLKYDALPHFLKAADSLNGVLLTVLVDKQLGSIFSNSGRLAREDVPLEALKSWPTATVERMLRATYFIGILLRGLSSPYQNLVWFLDHDDIVANEKRHRELVECFGVIAGNCLPHSLGHCRVGTAASDNGNRQVEDLIALPDLVVGALADAIPQMVANGLLSGRLAVAPPAMKPKAKFLLDWFSKNTTPLKRLVLVLDQAPDSKKCRITTLRMHGSNDR